MTEFEKQLECILEEYVKLDDKLDTWEKTEEFVVRKAKLLLQIVEKDFERRYPTNQTLEEKVKELLEEEGWKKADPEYFKEAIQWKAKEVSGIVMKELSNRISEEWNQ